MKRVTILFAGLALFSTGAVVWQHYSLSKLGNVERNENAAVVVTNFPTPAVQEQIIALREQTRELPKLRNEVGQLHAQRPELYSARGENMRLLKTKQAGPPVVVSRQQLTHAGYSTPDATVESFFWAMRESRLDLMIEALSPEHRDRKGFEALPAETRAEQISGFRAGGMGDGRFENFTDFTIEEREQNSEDTVVLSLRSSTGVKAAKYRLKRIGAEWKIEDLPL